MNHYWHSLYCLNCFIKLENISFKELISSLSYFVS
nr:MAG TPA: hypothetical protein [Crassvirales sp.]